MSAIVADAANQSKRLSREFWAIDDFWNIVRVTGFECPPNENVWWVPSLGYSMTEGFHLFSVFEDARQIALKKLSSNIHDLKLAYNRLLEAKEHAPNETNP